MSASRELSASLDLAQRRFDLVAIDLDGTLLRTDKNITQRTASAIRQTTQKGVKVVLCSARPPRSVREIHELLGLETVQINYNGALIHDRIAAHTVSHQPLAAETARAIVELARAMDGGIEVCVELLDTLRTDRYRATISTETTKRFRPDRVAPIASIIDQPVTKLMLLAHAQRLGPVIDRVAAEFSELAGLMQSDHTLLQCVNPAVDKGRALAAVAGQYGVGRERVLAIGDAPNDVPMLEWAGLGLAVDNAWTAARDAADAIVPANDDHGVAHALETAILR